MHAAGVVLRMTAEDEQDAMDAADGTGALGAAGAAGEADATETRGRTDEAAATELDDVTGLSHAAPAGGSTRSRCKFTRWCTFRLFVRRCVRLGGSVA